MIYLDEGMIEEFKNDVLNSELRTMINKQSMKNHNGKIKVGSSVSYVQQVPWIQNKTIRDNILFGLPLDKDRYNNTIHICQLASDLEILPGGDLTEIGEKGINLSGGQKARVSLARAVYANRDIILMDDPISALDSNVKKKVFEQVFMGEMKGKTRVLVTHAVDFIDKVDKIIIMEGGRIKYMGTYEELQHSDEIKHIIETLAQSSTTLDEGEEDSKINNEKQSEKEPEKKNFLSEDGSSITDKEDNEDIELGWDIYSTYVFSNFTWVLYVIIIPLFVAYSYLIVHNNINIGRWVENSQDSEHFWHYFMLILAYPMGYACIITIIFLMFTLSAVRIARIIFDKIIHKLMIAPINLYFDKTPSGRILNRLAADIYTLDDGLGHQIMWCCECYVSALFNVYLASLNSPWVLLIVPIVFGIVVVLLKYYIKTYRDMSRLQKVAYSPVVSHLGETITGATTIRTFNKQSWFVDQNYSLINTSINICFFKNAISRWFAIRLEVATIFIIIFTGGFCLLQLFWFTFVK